jgi:peptidoglycan hydrolase CwlO-like protein
MDIKTFENIKNKIEVLKQKKAKAEGAIESILADWEKTYGFSTLEEAEKHCITLKDEITSLDNKIEIISTELNGLTNWSLI